jgi:hypothetical protein
MSFTKCPQVFVLRKKCPQNFVLGKMSFRLNVLQIKCLGEMVPHMKMSFENGPSYENVLQSQLSFFVKISSLGRR